MMLSRTGEPIRDGGMLHPEQILSLEYKVIIMIRWQ